ncbi:MAG TPA: hypothetical protein VMU81_04570 [Acetobacteraceae bacterium]|nr:hypothetical protein [Acetobacteraceae bacterium]
MSHAAVVHGPGPTDEATKRDSPNLRAAAAISTMAFARPQVDSMSPEQDLPLATSPSRPHGDWNNPFGPRHGSQHETSGRMRHGTAPANPALPACAFDTDIKIKIG